MDHNIPTTNSIYPAFLYWLMAVIRQNNKEMKRYVNICIQF